MKKLALLLMVFCVGLLVASFAFADAGGGKGKDREKTATTSESGQKCRNVSLKGTAAAATFTITVERSSKAGRDLVGKPATLTFQGKVNVNARMCAAAPGTTSPATFQLRNLKVGKGGGDD
jgi:hypothetical protein